MVRVIRYLSALSPCISSPTNNNCPPPSHPHTDVSSPPPLFLFLHPPHVVQSPLYLLSHLLLLLPLHCLQPAWILLKAESSCRQSVIKSSNLYRGHVPTPSAEGTNENRLEVSQEKSVRSDTSVLTLIQSSAGSLRGSGGAGGRPGGSGGFGGSGSVGRGSAFRRESLSIGSLRYTTVSWIPPRALPVRYGESSSRARAQGVSPGRVVGKLSIRD